jgi:hypothetical protein
VDAGVDTGLVGTSVDTGLAGTGVDIDVTGAGVEIDSAGADFEVQPAIPTAASMSKPITRKMTFFSIKGNVNLRIHKITDLKFSSSRCIQRRPIPIPYRASSSMM